MKFQCDSCGAKYKIADEKVAGRNNVRFSCRRCSHKILLSDPGLNGSTSATTYGLATAGQPDKSDDFMTAKRPGVQSSAAPKSATDEPIWHVSINDVPIGPIKREELAHKIDSGAVNEYSLVWNSSFDEWRPLATVPELMSLIHNRRGSHPPMTSRFSSAPPEVRTKVAQVSEVLRASAVSQPTLAAVAPGLSDPFGQVGAVQPKAPAKSRPRTGLPNDFFAEQTVNTSLEDAFDQPTVSSVLDDQPTVNTLLDESLDQDTALGEELTMSSMLADEVTVNSMLDEQPTVNSLLDEANIVTSLLGDPFAPPSAGARRPEQLQNTPPPGIPMRRRDGSGSFSTVLTASSFTPEAPDGSVAGQPMLAAPEVIRQSRPAQDRRSVTAPHPLGQYPRASSSAVPVENRYPSVPRAPQPVATARTGMSPWAWAMVASFAVFAGVLAVLVFDKLVEEGQLGPFSFQFGKAEETDLPAETEITETEIVETELPDPAFVVEEPMLEEPPVLFDPEADALAPNSVQLSAQETDMEFELDEDSSDDTTEAEPEGAEEPQRAPKPRTGSKARTRTTQTKSSTAALSEDSGIRRLTPEDDGEDAKLLAQFEQSGASPPAKINVTDAPSTQAKRQPLDSKDLAAVVNKNKPRLQRCYERAVRGHQAPPAVRLDVAVKVAVSGRVSSATATGRGPGGLTECVESLVRRWRFPVSSEAVETRFPVVFAAN